MVCVINPFNRCSCPGEKMLTVFQCVAFLAPLVYFPALKDSRKLSSQALLLSLPPFEVPSGCFMGLFALFTGLSVEKMIDPEEVDEAVFVEMLGLLPRA